MINLYQILHLPPRASEADIRVALNNGERSGHLDAKTAQAVREWLLKPEVRLRYDARLQMEQPEFFQAAIAQPHVIEPNTTFKIKNKPVSAVREKSHYVDGTVEYVPELWNPKAAAIWSFFLNPILGAWLHAHNWRELGFADKARKHMTFVWIVSAFYFVTAVIAVLTGWQLPLYTTVVLWSGWFFSLGREQLDFVKNEVGEDYDRLGWLKPIVLTLVAVAGYFVLIIMLVLLAHIAGVLHPSWLAE